MKRLLGLFIPVLSICCFVFADVKPAGIFGDHMVMQRQKPLQIWGEAEPGEQVTVSLNDQSVTTQAKEDGTWQVELKPMEAGGPFELKISGKNEIVFQDVLLGEVWVCSGQSNMGFGVAGVLNAESEIANANYPKIRLFQKALDCDLSPCNRITGSWVVCSPETVGGFSAVGYFFGKKLYEDLNVPIGLVHSSWGATNAEQWISNAGFQSLEDLPSVKAYKKGVQDFDAASAEYEKKMEEWNRKSFTQDPGNKGWEKGWAKPDLSRDAWKPIVLPQFFEAVSGLNINGAVWFCKEVEIPADWAGKDLTLNLGPIDDYDTTYFNNVEVGATDQNTAEWWKHPRQYTVPGKLVVPGKNVIAVRVFDRWKEGGFGGTKEQMTLCPAGPQDQSISLAGEWRYNIEYGVETQTELPMPVGPISPHSMWSPGAIYNAMIYPLGRFTIRGITWYQGENNLYRWPEYKELLAGLVKDWRTLWNDDKLPFLVVQLPNFSTILPEPSDGIWARIRDAQLQVSRELPNCGLAVTIDVGDERDIHCIRKQEVGYRLALIAEGTVYGKDISYSGPVYESMTIEGDKIRLRFKHTAPGLTTSDGEPLKGFAMAGKDMNFIWADAVIDGQTVVVSSDKIKEPVAVRYAWADNPACNFCNKSGLPASPFKTDE